MGKVTYYQDRRGKWRWRITAANGQIIGASSQGFARKTDAHKSLERLRAYCHDAFRLKLYGKG